MPAKVFHRDFRGAAKRAELLASLDGGGPAYEPLAPSAANRFRLRPFTPGEGWADWMPVQELAREEPLNGLMEKRGGALMDGDRAALEARMRAYLDAKRPFDAVRAEIGGLGRDYADFDARRARAAVTALGGFDAARTQRYWLRAFEEPWAYLTPQRPLWNRARPALLRTAPEAGGFFVTRKGSPAVPEGYPSFWTALVGDNDALRGHAYFIPVLDNASGRALPNLSEAAAAWLDGIGLEPDADAARLVWHHALATTWAPAYLAAQRGVLALDWPRVPLPADADALRASAALGARLAALLDPATPVPGVTAGEVPPVLAAIAVPDTRPGQAKDWALRGWGSRDARGVTTPGRGQSSARPFTPGEAPDAAVAALLGGQARDVGMNAASQWRNIPEAVWEAHVGGYQVIKKWLSYRDHSIIGRALTLAAVTHVQGIARRLAAVLLLGPDLDASFAACAACHADQGRQDADDAAPPIENLDNSGG